MALPYMPAVVDKAEMEMMRDELEIVRGEINSLIGQIETVREDLYEKSGSGSIYCCCWRRRDLRKLEDRLWRRLHQLQEKENELHRQRTAILSRSVAPGVAGETQSPPLRRQPPPVSPEVPESPPWRQQQHRPPVPDRRHVSPSFTVSDSAEARLALPMRVAADASSGAVQRSTQLSSWQRQPVSAAGPPSLRRRPCRPGSAEDTGSGAE